MSKCSEGGSNLAIEGHIADQPLAKPYGSSGNLQKIPEQTAGGGAENPSLFRVGSGNFSLNPCAISTLSAQKSWDEASSGRSPDDRLASPRVTHNRGFDLPTPLRSVSGRKSSFDSIQERQERIMALNEVRISICVCVCLSLFLFA